MYRVLDCTLRDGAHVNGGDFGSNVIKDIILFLDRAKIDFIEFGFLDARKETSSAGNTFFSSLSQIDQTLEFYSGNAQLALLIRPDWTPVSSVYEKQKNVDLLRFAFYQRDQSIFLEHLKNARRLGYAISANPIDTPNYTIASYRDLLSSLELEDGDTLSLVDTHGFFTPYTALSFLETALDIYGDKINYGLHLHENQTNGETIIDSVVASNLLSKDKLIIDASLLGMGRRPGNIHLENLIMKNLSLKKKYDIQQILELIDRHLLPVFAEYNWGYHKYFELSGLLGIHRNYAEDLINADAGYSVAYKILNEISASSHRGNYNKDFLKRLIDETK